ncbi:LysM domain-containing protein [Vibrio sp. SCSIO 43136]|uniref:LysM peptidoglycan-binding domain-containing protein n=1 Tax=Vibrio sp. SCSIO 43136 TaxID=2819101 RepID=UPI002075BFA5|nr:LysM domain-containing protein [Vibrio sp. SCSIO 43136]USD65329.1 LysM peptidoglycan-binding domain-containing protein [Vibrio sp. SCSIO 43136]
MKGKLSKVSRVMSISLACLMSNSLAWAGSLDFRQDAPSQYTIKKGDTLWDISELYLKSPWRWPELWQANQYIQNPHLIYPGDSLWLTWKDGVPTLRLSRQDAPNTVAIAPVINSQTEQQIQRIRLVSSSDLEGANQIESGLNQRTLFSAGDLVHLQHAVENTRYAIYRTVSTHSVIGRDDDMLVLKQLGSVTLVDIKDNQSRIAQIEGNTLEVKAGDWVLPVLLSTDEPIEPTPAPSELTATILGNTENSHYSYQDAIVVIDKGYADGIELGQVFRLVESQELASLPNQTLGLAMVLKSYHHYSLAKVTASHQPIANQTLLIAPETQE